MISGVWSIAQGLEVQLWPEQSMLFIVSERKSGKSSIIPNILLHSSDEAPKQQSRLNKNTPGQLLTLMPIFKNLVVAGFKLAYSAFQ